MTTPVPSPAEVNRFHSNSDRDSSKTGQHHTLGIDPNQASPGNHNHNGKNSKKLGSITLTGLTTPTTVAQVDAILDQVITLLKQFTNITDNRA